MPIDADWAEGELRTFLALTDRIEVPRVSGQARVAGGRRYPGTSEEIEGSAYVVERIFDQIFPQWRSGVRGTEWGLHRRLAHRSIAVLRRADEVAQHLGDTAPRMSAGGLHPWVWNAARPLWVDGHYRAALHAVASSLTAQVQGKTGLNLADKQLFAEVLSLAAPAEGKPRLRVVKDDGSPTYKSAQEGALHLALGLYQGIRNITAHGTDELDQQIALERLAAYSVLARWLDAARVVNAGGR